MAGSDQVSRTSSGSPRRAERDKRSTAGNQSGQLRAAASASAARHDSERRQRARALAAGGEPRRGEHDRERQRHRAHVGGARQHLEPECPRECERRSDRGPRRRAVHGQQDPRHPRGSGEVMPQVERRLDGTREDEREAARPRARGSGSEPRGEPRRSEPGHEQVYQHDRRVRGAPRERQREPGHRVQDLHARVAEERLAEAESRLPERPRSLGDDAAESREPRIPVEVQVALEEHLAAQDRARVEQRRDDERRERERERAWPVAACHRRAMLAGRAGRVESAAWACRARRPRASPVGARSVRCGATEAA